MTIGEDGDETVNSLLTIHFYFAGNPLEEKHSSDGDWQERVTKSLKALKKLDGTPIIKDDEEED